MFPILAVAGPPYTRGRQYGEQARDRIHRSLAAYGAVFAQVTGWDWQRVISQARDYHEAIVQFGEQYVAELAGIADGADVTPDDVLALNVRTEILFPAQMQMAQATPLLAECTALAAVTQGGRVIAAQNWDWMPFARETVVVLRSEPDDGPAFVTVVEAGLLAKFGANSAGVAVLTNAMACDEDRGQPGVPYHVLLRALHGCGSTAEAVGVLESADRASSANYLIADSSGSVIDLEAQPGGPDRIHRRRPDARGRLAHTNHFVSPDFGCVDYADLVESTSQFRLNRVEKLIEASDGTRSEFAAALTDHEDSPGSICRHPDRSLPMSEQVETVASGIFDLTSGRIQLSDGPPCEGGYEELPPPGG